MPELEEMTFDELLRAYGVRCAEVAVTRNEEAALVAYTTLGPMQAELSRRFRYAEAQADIYYREGGHG